MTNQRPRYFDLLHLLWGCFWGPVWVLLLHPIWRKQAPLGETWVIGGHRGRLYADNSRALEREARGRGVEVYWIANDSRVAELEALGVRVLVRHSWAARRAISKASVLVYSHGEDDLDAMMAWLRGKTALRCYLNHGHNLLKAGGVYEPGWDAQKPWIKALRTWLITDCDRFICGSPIEQSYFEKSYPMHCGKFRLGGAAHLDDYAHAQTEWPKKRIYWFPTFREHASARHRLRDVIMETTQNSRLRAWLTRHEYEFLIGQHINTGTAPLTLQPPFRTAPVGTLVQDLAETDIFISDYSSLTFDFLLFERPPILFAFDLTDYCQGRYLYQDYNQIDYAVQVRSVEELVTAICSDLTRSVELKARVSAARRQLLPSGTEFAAATFLTIKRELAAREPENEQP